MNALISTTRSTPGPSSVEEEEEEASPAREVAEVRVAELTAPTPATNVGRHAKIIPTSGFVVVK